MKIVYGEKIDMNVKSWVRNRNDKKRFGFALFRDSMEYSQPYGL
jgi:hypothetical protein